jgi:DUF1680 family protein
MNPTSCFTPRRMGIHRINGSWLLLGALFTVKVVMAGEPGRILCQRQDWGQLVVSRSVLSNQLTIGQTTFEHGLGTHANSVVRIELAEPADRFEAKVGVDHNPDTKPNKGSVQFIVELDNRARYTSPVLRSGMEPVAVSVALEGARTFVLRVTDAGDGISYDQADWAAAKVILKNGKEIALHELPVTQPPKPSAPVSIPPPAATPLPDSWRAVVTNNAAVPLWRPADVRQTKLEGEWGRRMDVTGQRIAKTDLAKLLGQLGNSKPGAVYLGLGKFMDATSRLAAYDPSLRPTRDALINGVLAAQSPEGYIGCWKPGPLLATTGQWEVHELTYIIVGLCTDYRYFGEKRVLDAARRAGDYLITHLRPLREHCAQGLIGLDLALLALSEQTGDTKYRDFLLQNVAPTRWEPYDRAPFDHLYEWLALDVGQLQLCSCAPDPKLLFRSHRLLEHLDAGGGLLVTGGSSHHEKVNTTHASDVLVETCSTAYLIRALGRTFELTGDLRCLEIIERSVNNALFAAQTPDGATIYYFTEHEGKGRHGPYVCCPMNYLRIISELPEHVAYARPNAIALAQYVPGRYEISLDNQRRVALEIATAYPADDLVQIKVAPGKPGRFALHLRIPEWCPNPQIELGGKAQPASQPGSWTVIERAWRDGDTITLRLPMHWQWVSGKATQTGKRALLRGPLVWRLDPTRSNLAGLNLDAVVPVTVPDAPERSNLTVYLKDETATADLLFVPYAAPGGTKLWFQLPRKCGNLSEDSTERK